MIVNQMKKSTEDLSRINTDSVMKVKKNTKYSDSPIKVPLMNTTHPLFWSCIRQTRLTQVQQLPWRLSPSDNGRALCTISGVFSVSCSNTFTLSYCSTALSHPLILPLCLYEEACSPAEVGYRVAGLKIPRGERFLNPSCPPGLMQCFSVVEFLCQALQEVPSYDSP